jgi:hypothetical protein
LLIAQVSNAAHAAKAKSRKMFVTCGKTTEAKNSNMSVISVGLEV